MLAHPFTAETAEKSGNLCGGEAGRHFTASRLSAHFL